MPLPLNAAKHTDGPVSYYLYLLLEMAPVVIFLIGGVLLFGILSKRRNVINEEKLPLYQKNAKIDSPASGNATFKGALAVGTSALGATAGDISWSGALSGQATLATVIVGNASRGLGVKLQESVSVKDYGATGNGTTDDTAAIQSAIDSAISGTLIFPPGIYIVSTSILFRVSGVRYSCAGGLALIKAAPSLASGIVLGQISASNVTLEGIGFDGNESFPPLASNNSLCSLRTASASLDGVSFIRCTFQNTKGYGVLAFDAFNALTNLLFLNCVFQQFNNVSGAPPAAIQIVWPLTVTGVRVTDCRFLELSGTGFSVRANNGSASPSDIIVCNSEFLHNRVLYTSIGAEIYGNNVSITGNTFRAARMGLSLVDCTTISITGNTFTNHDSYSIEAAGVTNGTITGNTFDDFMVGIICDRDCQEVTVTGNSFTLAKSVASNNGWALKLESAYSFRTIAFNDNIVKDCAGVRFDNVSGYSICGNSFLAGGTIGTSPIILISSSASTSTGGNVCNNLHSTAYDLASTSTGAIAFTGQRILIDSNIVSSSTAAANIGIAICNVGGVSTTDVTISNNLVKNYSVGVSTNSGNPSSNNNVQQIDNTAVSCTTPSAATSADVVRTRRIITRQTAPTAGSYNSGDVCFNAVPTNGSILGFTCTTSGSPGTWLSMGMLNQFALTVIGDADVTLTPLTARGVQLYNSPLTANRTVTLSSTNAWLGLLYRITRTSASTGAFVVNVGTGPLAALSSGEWVDVGWFASGYVVLAKGTL